MINNILLIVFIVLIIWLITLSFLLWRLLQRFNAIFKSSLEKSVVAVLERTVKETDYARKDIDSLLSRLSTLEDKNLENIQKVGLIRFNPFNDTGGEQSFIIALLDAKNSGVVLSGLYSRSGMRWYAKKVAKGQGEEYELSEEEKKAINTAK